jgi:cobalamin biosynthesis protein CobT
MDVEREPQPEMGRETTKHPDIGIDLAVLQLANDLVIDGQHVGELLDTQAMIDAVADDRMRHLTSERRGGPSQDLSCAIGHSRGSMLALLHL